MLRGILSTVIASILFGIIPSANKYLLLNGMGEDCVLFWQLIIMIVGAAVVMVLTGHPMRIPFKMLLELLGLGIIGMGMTDYLLNLAYTKLPVSTVVMLHFLYPTIVLMIMTLVFRQKLSPITIGAITLSLIGLMLVSDVSELNLLGILFSLGSATTYAFFSVMNDKGNVNQLPLITKLFYMSIGSVVVFGPKTVISGNLRMPGNMASWLILIVVIGLGSLFAFYCITDGIKRVGASRAAFLNMLEPIAGVIVGVIAYHEVLSGRTLVGCLCVLLSILLIALDSVRAMNAHVPANSAQ